MLDAQDGSHRVWKEMSNRKTQTTKSISVVSFIDKVDLFCAACFYIMCVISYSINKHSLTWLPHTHNRVKKSYTILGGIVLNYSDPGAKPGAYLICVFTIKCNIFRRSGDSYPYLDWWNQYTHRNGECRISRTVS